MTYDTDRLDTDATEFLRAKGIDDQGEDQVIDPVTGNRCKRPRRDAFTAGKCLAEGDLTTDWMGHAAFNEGVFRHEMMSRPIEAELYERKKWEDKLKHAAVHAYLTDIATAPDPSQLAESAEHGKRLLATALSPLERDVLAATVYMHLATFRSATRVEWLKAAMGCSSDATVYDAIRRGNEVLRNTIIAIGGELPSTKGKSVRRARIELRIATKGSQYDTDEWRAAIDRMPASLQFDLVHALARQIVGAGLEAARSADAKLKMMPHRVLNALDELGLNTLSVREALGTMSEAERDAWVAETYAKALRLRFLGTPTERAAMRERLKDELLEKHVKDFLALSRKKAA